MIKINKVIVVMLLLASTSLLAKPLMITITIAGCNWCEMMKHNVLLKSSVRAKLDKKFRVVIADKNEKEKIPKVIKKTKLFPTTYIVENGKLVDELPGYMSAEDLLNYFDIDY
jgi:thioredoxin-related protein